MLIPKLFTILKSGYSKQYFLNDLYAGIIVGIVALPLAMAFAVASGLSPEKGLYTAIIAGFVTSIFGGSRVQISGPTGALIIIVYEIVQIYGLQGLITATFLAGLILVLLGFARLGSVIQFIPQPLIIGFTSGIACVIFMTQIGDLLGLNIGVLPPNFVDKLCLYTTNICSVNIYALIISIGSFLITFNFYRITSKIPPSLVAVIISTAITSFFLLPVETIASRFGEIPSSLPSLTLPDLRIVTIFPLLKSAFTIALLGAITSLLSAVVADGMIGAGHRSNMELIAQGLGNICSSLFGGIPSTGAIARTAINIKNGGRTPIAGVIHAIFLLIIVLFFGPWTKLIPLSCLAGILAVVAYNMSEWRTFVAILKGPRSDMIILLTTFLLTVFFNLTIAIEIGMVLAALLFMRDMAQISNVESITNQLVDPETIDESSHEKIKKVDGVEIYEIQGPLFFGNVYHFKELLRRTHTNPKIVILRMRHVSLIDASGLHYLKDVIKEFHAKKIQVILSGVQPSILKVLKKNNIMDYLGNEYIFRSIADAVHYAHTLLNQSVD